MAAIFKCAILLVLTAAVLMVPSAGKIRRSSTKNSCQEIPQIEINDVKFLLYTRKNPNVPFEITSYSKDSEHVLYLNPCHKYKFITHGYKGSGEDDWILRARDEYLEKGDYNVIVVDWSKHAALHFGWCKATKPVGEHIANLVIGLNKKYNFKCEKIHLIGHAVGAHVMGCAGKRFHKITTAKIGRITGTDPAGPLYAFPIDGDITLSKNDATFVDVIHTDGLRYGYYDALGHVDFYPNGGKHTQPGCSEKKTLSWLKNDLCSHDRAQDLFVESINSKKFIARECKSYDSYKKRQCMGKTAIMGENVNRKSLGVYYLQTNWKTPYARNDRIKG